MIKEIKKPFLDQYIPKRRFHFRLFLFVVHCSFSESFSILTVIPLSLFPLSPPIRCLSLRWLLRPLIGPDRSRDLNTRLLLAARHSDGCSGSGSGCSALALRRPETSCGETSGPLPRVNRGKQSEKSERGIYTLKHGRV